MSAATKKSADVTVVGRGKVGSSLVRAWRRSGWRVEHRAARGIARSFSGRLLVVAARDGQLGEVATRLARLPCVARMGGALSVVHCAGALGPEVLAPLREHRAALGVMHPLLAFAGPATRVDGAAAVIWGDPWACRRARAAARRAGMRAVVAPAVDASLYHAAAALLANGAAALLGVSGDLLARAGVADTAALVGLLRSVADNVERQGLPRGLSGPVRRGDAATVRAHLDRIGEVAPGYLPLYRALVAAQLAMARELGEASPEKFDAIEHISAETPHRATLRRR